MREEKKMENNQTEEDDKGDAPTMSVFPPQRILAPIDGSDNALRALKAAVVISKTYGAKLFIITVTKRDKLDQTLDLPGSTSTVQNYNDEMDRRSERLLDDSFDLATKEGLTDVETEAIPEFESVTKQILESSQSKKVDLIVLGTRGLGGFKKLLQGSVSSAVVTHADCNVLVVR